MRLSVRFCSCFVAAGLAFCPAPAMAEEPTRPYPPCDRTPTQGDISSAKGAFDAGNGSFNEADYERAIMYWEDAYRRDCTAHPLLLNLARAYELNGQKKHAVNALETFLTRVPNSSEESQIKRRIDKLQEQIEVEAAAARAAAPAAAAAQAPKEPPPGAKNPPPQETKEPSSGGSKPILPLIVGGVGVAMFVAGGIVWLVAQSDISDFEKQCPGRQCPTTDPSGNPIDSDALTKKGNEAITRRDISGVIALVGAGAIVGGGIWYVLSKPSQSAGAAPHGFTAHLTPALAPGYGGLTLVGAF
jgi:ribosomal protein L12E/L44/L45/RPP1/RPP2